MNRPEGWEMLTDSQMPIATRIAERAAKKTPSSFGEVLQRADDSLIQWASVMSKMQDLMLSEAHALLLEQDSLVDGAPTEVNQAYRAGVVDMVGKLLGFPLIDGQDRNDLLERIYEVTV